MFCLPLLSHVNVDLCLCFLQLFGLLFYSCPISRRKKSPLFCNFEIMQFEFLRTPKIPTFQNQKNCQFQKKIWKIAILKNLLFRFRNHKTFPSDSAITTISIPIPESQKFPFWFRNHKFLITIPESQKLSFWYQNHESNYVRLQNRKLIFWFRNHINCNIDSGTSISIPDF